ncbi:HD domain-containing protein [Clostridium ganghwense]|uniref:HD domain-containing protein n=1 Tax=Clostridium ganghwense TaxID=312089 RepID=A0ABT4CP18_9CLOT|nr:HD domain-containing protein [Clostridium ganghwense]MCY6370805.1 HD domain-containing protein [Clostridium ganghwense]
MELERVNKILHHEKFKEYMKKITKHERKREFCKHDIQHFLDAARIAYILNLEKNLGINKEIIYAVGLLHDIGRWRQYEDGTPHNIASSDLSERILIDSGFTEGERKEIRKAILGHRKKDKDKSIEEEDSLRSIFYKADKLSRNCFNCRSKKKCNWPDEKKNLDIYY